MPSIVALDIETTGLDPRTDRMIEIGAIRFSGNRIEDEFSTLINPNILIPKFIEQLTGISSTMVQNSPQLDDIIPELEEFVGGSPILGHNVSFDMAFLNESSLFLYNQAIDTYALASALMPGANRYGLGSLGQQLGILFPATHRALDDARVTYAVYNKLIEFSEELSIDIIAEIVRVGDNVDWGGNYLFEDVLQRLSKDPVSHRSRIDHIGPIYSNPPPPNKEPLAINEELVSLDIEEVSSILDRGGEFSKTLTNFEFRPEQVELSRQITDALSESKHLIAEAGTGVGKSFAYLVPAAIWSLKNNARVVISTNTINLQDQLLKKDIPDIENIIGDGLSTAVLKGRNNYFCPRRFEAFRRKGPENRDEMRVFCKLLIWLTKTESGDRSEITLRGSGERMVWNQVSSDDMGCSTENCVRRTGGICPYHRAKFAAGQAHILIVNHSLLLADVASGNRVLPDFDYLIVDEAHHLESATTNSLSFRVTQLDIERTIREIGGTNSGLLGRILVIAGEMLPPEEYKELKKIADSLTDNAYQLQNSTRNFFITINEFLKEMRGGRAPSPYAQQERVIPSTRTQPFWLQVEVAWEDTQTFFEPLVTYIKKISDTLKDFIGFGSEEAEDQLGNMLNVILRLEEYSRNIDGLVFEPETDRIYWAELNPNNNMLSLNAAPLHIGNLMEEHLWHKKSSVILTSATLSTGGDDFSYIVNRLNGEDAFTTALGSPFDYENSTLLYVPNNIPEPNDRMGHQKALERGIINLATEIGGKTLVLFTSYTQLQTTSKAISSALAKKDISVYEQGQGASPHSLLESFKNSDQAVLLGTRAFWEGVDVPGQALSALIIARLPFSVPSDPIVAARSETFEQSFYQYSIPEAILTFRQGFGRLIRSHQDRGVVAVFDKRILTKQYGQLFFDALPNCTKEVGPLEELPKKASSWLGF